MSFVSFDIFCSEKLLLLWDNKEEKLWLHEYVDTSGHFYNLVSTPVWLYYVGVLAHILFAPDNSIMAKPIWKPDVDWGVPCTILQCILVHRETDLILLLTSIWCHIGSKFSVQHVRVHPYCLHLTVVCNLGHMG